jgi:hypothetical protein
MKKIILMLTIFSIVLNGKCQTKEQHMLRKMTSFFEKTIITTYQKSESSYSAFFEDFIEEQENGKTTEIISYVNVEELYKLNKKMKSKNMFHYYYRYDNLKNFKNINSVPDSIFESFKLKYKYNAVKLSSCYLKYYLNNNNSELAQYIKQQYETIGEISPITISLFLKHRLNELSCRKNEELITLLFWPYLCYRSGLFFYPNNNQIKVPE